MASESLPGHSKEIMVAQPVDTITAGSDASREAMAADAGSLDAKEASTDMISGISDEPLDYSESPPKTTRSRSSTPKMFTPRSSPSPSRKSISTTRRGSLKRPTSMPLAIPMMPRRGRAAVTDQELWGDSGRMVMRKVEPKGASPEALLESLQEQVVADGAAIRQLYGAIVKIASATNTRAENGREIDRKLDEQVRMRMDDHRLHVVAMTQLRNGQDVVVQEVNESQTKFKNYIDVQDKAVILHLETKLEEVKGSVETALDQIHKTENEMKQYLVELEQARPEEGKLVFNAFSHLKGEVAAIQAVQQAQALATAGLSSATAAGIHGLASAGGSAEHATMLEALRVEVQALVQAEQTRPCHCPDVDSNTARIAYL